MAKPQEPDRWFPRTPELQGKWPSFDRLVPVYSYYIGIIMVHDREGMPILGEDGTEFNINPTDFELEGMPGADTYRFSPTVFDRKGGQ